MGKFNLTEEAFQAGLSAEEFIRVTDEQGRDLYCWAQHSAKAFTGKSGRLEIVYLLLHVLLVFEILLVFLMVFAGHRSAPVMS